MTHLLMVSKDRPCQLDLAIRSIFKNFHVPYKGTVLYTYSSDFYKEGYDKILNLYSDKFTFVKEVDFKSDVISGLKNDYENYGCKYYTSMGDDVLVYKELTPTKEFEVFDSNPLILALNYRMGPNIEVVFEGDPPQELPIFKDGLIWNWQESKAPDWHYSMAMMGQFYRISDLIDYLPTLNITSPTMFESYMVGSPLNHMPLMICFNESKIIELQVNRVQNIAINNRAGNIGLEFLNNIWLSGKRIKDGDLYNLPVNTNRFFYPNFEYEVF